MTEKNYKVVNQTSYSEITPDKVIEWLETSRERKQRIRIFYGDILTGRDWREENDTIGYIGRSNGNKIPLLIKSSRSFGGSAILDHCIVKITVDRKTVYQKENYHLFKKSMTVSVGQNLDFPFCVHIDEQLQGQFKTKEKAESYVLFLKGERNKI